MTAKIIFISMWLNVNVLNCVVQPKVQKGKAAEKVAHPFSRKAAYLAREELRLKKKERCVAV